MPTSPKSGPPAGWSQTGWGAPPPPPKPPSAEELLAAAVRLRERLRLFLITVIGLLVVWQLALPFRLAGLVLAGFGIWTGIRVLIGMSAERRFTGKRPRGFGVVILGLVLTAGISLMLVSEAVLYPVVSDLEKCEAGANTQAARAACEQSSKHRFEKIRQKLENEEKS